ncbi:MAG: diaminopimelate epimerase [Thermoleophilia bacterium]|jgi:diaminopimelate epimerase|nr:diaminopimelate epimerase [Thermoleophilia bacterium]
MTRSAGRRVSLSTWDALGNTYVVAERHEGALTADEVRALCPGVDGLVEIVAAARDEADVVVWNADGSTAELSGNGTRIAARWLAERTGAAEVVIRVGEREVRARLLPQGEVETDLGPVTVGGRERIDGVDAVRVVVGNPHVVVETDPDEIERLGPLLVAHPRFPHGTNVEAVRIERPGEVTARVWERGVGETSASGTGAVAAAAATHDEGDVTVHFPGGDLRVRLERGRALLTGPATRIQSSRF